MLYIPTCGIHQPGPPRRPGTSILNNFLILYHYDYLHVYFIFSAILYHQYIFLLSDFIICMRCMTDSTDTRYPVPIPMDGLRTYFDLMTSYNNLNRASDRSLSISRAGVADLTIKILRGIKITKSWGSIKLVPSPLTKNRRRERLSEDLQTGHLFQCSAHRSIVR